MSSLFKEFLAQRPAVEVVMVNLPGRPQTPVRLRRLSVNEVLAMPEEKNRWAITAASVIDDDGKPVFADADAVGQDYGIAHAIVPAVMAVNGIDVEAAEKKS
jgi:hypothetical protein